MTTLKGRNAVVTGASRGIGRAIAITLAARGARVLIHFGSSKLEADKVVAEIQAAGGEAHAVQADLAHHQGAAVLAAAARELFNQRIDILVCNAGISKAGSMEDHTIELFDSLFAINVRSPFFLVRDLLGLFSSDASIVIVTSIVARSVPGDSSKPGNPFLPAYAATKGALETLVKHWASMFGPRGIRVNAVAPGVIDTDMSNFTKTDAGIAATLQMQALKRIGNPSDVADVVAFLASDQARWVTGVSIPADGGSKL